MNVNYDEYLLTRNCLLAIDSYPLQLEWCEDYQQALDSMLNHLRDIYFIDYHTRGKAGIDYLIEAMIDSCDSPIILMTGKENQFFHKKTSWTTQVTPLCKSELHSEKLELCVGQAVSHAIALQESRRTVTYHGGIFQVKKDNGHLKGQVKLHPQLETTLKRKKS